LVASLPYARIPRSRPDNRSALALIRGLRLNSVSVTDRISSATLIELDVEAGGWRLGIYRRVLAYLPG
jgi:hypothetical protein